MSARRRPSEAPVGLSERAGAFYAEVVASWSLGAPQLLLLEEACRALDRATQAADEVAEYGVTMPDRYGGRKQNPAVDVEARNRALFSRLVAQLEVSAKPKPTPGAKAAAKAATATRPTSPAVDIADRLKGGAR